MNNKVDDKYPNLDRWTRPRCYAGATWYNYFYSGFGRSRESSTTEESNFQVVIRELAILPEWTPPPDEKQSPSDCPNLFPETPDKLVSRYIVRESHFLVGWVEWIAIHETDDDALALCDRLIEKEENYPVLDSDHLSELESDLAYKIWKGFSNKDRIDYMRTHSFSFESFAEMLGCARGKDFYGDDSELCQP